MTDIPLSLLNLLPPEKKKELLDVLRIMKGCDKEEECIQK